MEVVRKKIIQTKDKRKKGWTIMRYQDVLVSVELLSTILSVDIKILTLKTLIVISKGFGINSKKVI